MAKLVWLPHLRNKLRSLVPFGSVEASGASPRKELDSFVPMAAIWPLDLELCIQSLTFSET